MIKRRMRNFVRRVGLSRPPAELDYSWNKYLDSVADWSADIMVNINGLEQYYAGTDKPFQFAAIQKKFLALEDVWVDLRSSEAQSAPQMIPRAKSLTNEINTDLYFLCPQSRSLNLIGVSGIGYRAHEAVR